MKYTSLPLKILIIALTLLTISFKEILTCSKVFSFTNGIPSVYGQLGYEYSPYLDFVAINNNVVQIDGNGILQTEVGDVIKVSGKAQPLSTVNVYFNNITYDASVDEYGNWFVVFSVLNTSTNALPINVDLTTPQGEKLSTTFFSVLITDFVEEQTEIVEDDSNDFFKNIGIGIGIIALCLVSGFIGWIFGTKRIKR